MAPGLPLPLAVTTHLPPLLLVLPLWCGVVRCAGGGIGGLGGRLWPVGLRGGESGRAMDDVLFNYPDG
eukprot:COSAG02_NODE_2270_length_9267_cov_13.803992_12_plen_68_part_00